MTRVLPTIPTFVSGPLASAQLNTLANAVAFALDVPCFRMYQSVSQNVPNGADTQVLMDTPDYDSDNGRSGISPYNYTIPSNLGARWTFSAAVMYAGNATGTRVTSIRKNGAVLPDGGILSGAGANVVHGYLATVTVPVAAGDIISVWTWQNSGGVLGTNVTAASGLCYFEGRLASLANP